MPVTDDPTKQEVVARAPWPVQLWLTNCELYDSAPTKARTVLAGPHIGTCTNGRLERVHRIATTFSSDVAAMLTDHAEGCSFIRTDLNVKSHDGGQLISKLVDCDATHDFVSEDFARRFSLQTRKSKTGTPVQLANGQRVTSSTVCEIPFELARYEAQRNFKVVHDLRAAHMDSVYYG
jgi:hypothetical protein